MARRKKTTDDISAENSAYNEDENFGLPDIDYEPLDRDAPVVQEVVIEQYVTPQPEQTYSYQTDTTQPVEQYSPTNTTAPPTYTDTESDSEERSMAPKIIGIVLILLLAAAITWYFASYRPKQAAEKALIEQKRKEAEKLEQQKLAEEQRLAEERRKAEELAAAANAIPKEGTIETISGRTQHYYVVAASSIDADLIMDYAKKLSKKGISSKIIPPYGKTKFSRLTVAEGETYADTQKIADGMKGEYGDALWVIKY